MLLSDAGDERAGINRGIAALAEHEPRRGRGDALPHDALTGVHNRPQQFAFPHLGADPVLRHVYAGVAARHAADLRPGAHDGDAVLRRRLLRLPRPEPQLPHLAEDAGYDARGDLLRFSAALVRLQDQRVGTRRAQRGSQRRSVRRVLGINPDEIGAQRPRLGNQPVGVRLVHAHLVELALVMRGGVHVQHQLGAQHVLHDGVAQDFQRRTLRIAGKGEVHVQPRPHGNHALHDVQAQRVEHGIDIHEAPQVFRLPLDTVRHLKTDELAHHLVAVRSRRDAQAPARQSGIVPGAADGPLLVKRHGSACDFYNLFGHRQNDLLLCECMRFGLLYPLFAHFNAEILPQIAQFCKIKAKMNEI